MSTVQFAGLYLSMILLAGVVAFPVACGVAVVLDWWDRKGA